MQAVDRATGEIIHRNGATPPEQTAIRMGDFCISRTGLTVTGAPTYEDWAAIGETLRFLEGAIQWALGDWLNYGEHRWGEKYAQAVDEKDYDYDYGTLRNLAWVAGSIDLSFRNDNLTFAHHMQVAPLRLPDGTPDKKLQRYYLDVAQKEKLSVAQLRGRIGADRERQRRLDAAQTPLPSGQYRCIVIDPPWDMQKIEREDRPRQGEYLDYPTMTLEDIAALPVRDLAFADGCHLYLWTTHKYLPDALSLVAGWGFHYQCLMTWVKPGGMTPYSWMYNTEHVLFARMGDLPLLKNGMKLSFDAPAIGHSIKPDVFYERVLLASPEPRYEMFARRERDGFIGWGNEADAG